MKTLLSILTIVSFIFMRGQVGINTSSVDPSAMLHVESSVKGLLLPVINNPATVLTVINTPSAEGLTVYDQSISKSLAYYKSDQTWETSKSSSIVPYNIYPNIHTISSPVSGTLYQHTDAHTFTFTVNKRSLVELNPDMITRESLSSSTRYNFFYIQSFTLRRSSDNAILETINMKERAINVSDNFSGGYHQRVWISRILDPGTYYLRLDFGHQRAAGTSFVSNMGMNSMATGTSGSIIITEVN